MNKILLLLSLFLLSCAHQDLPRTKLNTNKPIQVISVTNDSAIFAQKDVVVEDADLNIKLAKMNTQWKDDLKQSVSYRRYSVGGLILSLLSVSVCVASINTDIEPYLPCGAFALGAFVSSKYIKKSERLRKSVIERYNNSLDERFE